jgi:hypothetical protein
MAGRALMVSLMLLTMAGAAGAQEKGQVGLVIGYPASAGIVWHLSERLAVRPDVTFSRSTNEQTNVSLTPFASTSGASGDNWQVTAGLSALFYVHRRDALRMYVSPRFAYSRSTSTSTNTNALPLGGTTTFESAIAQYSAAGSFGVQYSLGRTFSLFGEIGAAYTDVESSSTLSVTRIEGTTRTISTRSGVGVVLYF